MIELDRKLENRPAKKGLDENGRGTNEEGIQDSAVQME
jgi:hypothetical protein